MDIKRSGSQPSTKGSADYFTGAVRIDPLFEANDPARAVGANVTFEPGARTAWHTHPLGQNLIVTAGAKCGRPPAARADRVDRHASAGGSFRRSPAERMQMSQRHFARAFAAEAGCTPARFVEQNRMAAAAQLLRPCGGRRKGSQAAAVSDRSTRCSARSRGSTALRREPIANASRQRPRNATDRSGLDLVKFAFGVLELETWKSANH
jgi:hypothetical protein